MAKLIELARKHHIPPVTARKAARDGRIKARKVKDSRGLYVWEAQGDSFEQWRKKAYHRRGRL